MKQSADLKRLLTSIDHKSYPAYKDVRGACVSFQGQYPGPPRESRISGRTL